ncbi:hypothetical protein APHAL10511_007234 [Amanita phalloides]|nr:hypothetical protein APHAL10511_007234 [Amanita phalloides]
MLSKVVHRLKRRFRKRDARDSQPPDLRRWSDFMKPFPHVELGGYTRYYQNHGLSLDRSPVASTESSNPGRLTYTSSRRTSKPKVVLPPIQLPDYSSSMAPEAPSPSSPDTNSSNFSSNASCSTCYPASKVALIDIPEESATSMIRGKVHHGPPEALGGSLRRRKLRILRTTNTENDTFWKHGPSSVAGSLSYTLSDESAMSNETKLDSPHTTMATLVTDLACSVYKITAGGESTDYCDERPDSRSSFCTARSDFGD